MKHYRYSTLGDYNKCPKYYELKHLLKLDDGSDKSGDMAFGTALHLAIQDLFEGGNGHDVFNVFWEAATNKELEYTRYKHDELAEFGKEFIDLFVPKMSMFKPLHLEQKLMMPVTAEYGFSGTADFLGEFKGVKSVVDWKTSALPYTGYKIRCNEQMYGYAELAYNQLQFEAEQAVYVVFIKDHKNPRIQVKVTPLTREKVTKKLDNIKAICHDIHNRTTYHKNSSQCVIGSRVCRFFNTCHGDE